jgi:hypothetical protein
MRRNFQDRVSFGGSTRGMWMWHPPLANCWLTMRCIMNPYRKNRCLWLNMPCLILFMCWIEQLAMYRADDHSVQARPAGSILLTCFAWTHGNRCPLPWSAWKLITDSRGSPSNMAAKFCSSSPELQLIMLQCSIDLFSFPLTERLIDR